MEGQVDDGKKCAGEELERVSVEGQEGVRVDEEGEGEEAENLQILSFCRAIIVALALITFCSAEICGWNCAHFSSSILCHIPEHHLRRRQE